jgi:hypothetical protein
MPAEGEWGMYEWPCLGCGRGLHVCVLPGERLPCNRIWLRLNVTCEECRPEREQFPMLQRLSTIKAG